MIHKLTEKERIREANKLKMSTLGSKSSRKGVKNGSKKTVLTPIELAAKNYFKNGLWKADIQKMTPYERFKIYQEFNK